MVNTDITKTVAINAIIGSSKRQQIINSAYTYEMIGWNMWTLNNVHTMASYKISLPMQSSKG